MIYKMELIDSVDDMIFPLLEVPIADKDITGIADNTTVDGNVFRDYLWLKKQWTQKWSIMCQDEYNRLRGFWTRQFGNAEVPFYRLFYGDNVYEDKTGYTVNGFVQIENDAPLYSPLSLTHLYGNATQQTYSGKNLFHFTHSVSASLYGVTITASADTSVFKLNGTSTATSAEVSQVMIGTSNPLKLKAGTYTCKITGLKQYTVQAERVYLAPTSAVGTPFVTLRPDNGWTRTFTLASDTDAVMYLILSNQSSHSNTEVALQIESGSTATDYEPYCGGSPMPNPSFPSDVNVVSGAQTVQIMGKNLFDNTLQPAYTSRSTAQTINTGYRTTSTDNANIALCAFVLFKSSEVLGKSITLSYTAEKSASNTPNSYIGLCDASGNNRTAKTNVIAGDGYRSGTYTHTEEDATRPYIMVALYSNYSGTAQNGDYVDYKNLQLELSDTPSQYEPYQGQRQEINLGKNLFDGSQVSTTASSNWGISFENNVLTIEHKNTYTTGTPEATIGTLPSGTYVFSGTLGGGVGLYKDNTYIQMLSNGSTFTCNGREVISVKFSNSSATTLTYTNVMLEAGTQATSYAPFMLGKNLFDKSTITAGYYIDANGDLVADASNFVSDYISINADIPYIVSATTNNAKRIAYYDGSKTFISRQLGSASSVQLTIPSGAKYVRLSCYNTDLDTLQLETGTQATYYEPYGAQLELLKIGNYTDGIKQVGDKWYIHKEIGKIVFNGSQTSGWSMNTHSGTHITMNYQNDIIASLPYGSTFKPLCDNFKGGGLSETWSGSLTYGVSQWSGNGTTKYLQFSTPSNFVADLTDWATWLSTHNTTVYYALATPTDTEITDSDLIEQLDHIYSLYGGVNNIMLIPSGGAQGEINFKYRLNYEQETDIVPKTPVVLTLSDGGVINTCGCRENIQLIMRETTQGNSES